jgi:hypothetical protein
MAGKARTALIAGLVAFAVSLIAGPDVISMVALTVALLLLFASAVMVLRSHILLLGGLFACGVLVFADADAVASAAFVATFPLLLAVGFTEGRLRAVWLASALLLSALAADVLWQIGWEPFDRSDDYEAIPQSPFVLIALPVPMAVIAAGVGLRALWRRFGAPSTRTTPGPR